MASKKQQAYLKSIYAHSGLYLITAKNDYSKTKKMHVKIGIAGDFHDRFGAYLLCYPTGFYVFSLFLTLDESQAARLERSIHKYLGAKYKFIVTKHSHGEEIFTLTLAEVATLIETIEANVGVKFHKGDDNVSKKDQAGEKIFPYIDILPGIFLDENLAKGGTRIKAFSGKVKDFIDASYTNEPITTSAKKKKHKSVTLPEKGMKIPKMAALPEEEDEDEESTPKKKKAPTKKAPTKKKRKNK
jgi:hypothetical protein